MKQHAGEAGVVELEMPLVVELKERGAVRVALLQVQVVQLGLLRRVAAVLAHVHLWLRNIAFICWRLSDSVLNSCMVCTVHQHTFDLLCLYS